MLYKQYMENLPPIPTVRRHEREIVMNGYEVDVARGQDFIAWAVDTFAGSAHISFEGEFSPEAFNNIPGSSTEPNDVLKRNTQSS